MELKNIEHVLMMTILNSSSRARDTMDGLSVVRLRVTANPKQPHSDDDALMRCRRARHTMMLACTVRRQKRHTEATPLTHAHTL